MAGQTGQRQQLRRRRVPRVDRCDRRRSRADPQRPGQQCQVQGQTGQRQRPGRRRVPRVDRCDRRRSRADRRRPGQQCQVQGRAGQRQPRPQRAPPQYRRALPARGGWGSSSRSAALCRATANVASSWVLRVQGNPRGIGESACIRCTSSLSIILQSHGRAGGVVKETTPAGQPEQYPLSCPFVQLYPARRLGIFAPPFGPNCLLLALGLCRHRFPPLGLDSLGFCLAKV